MHISIKFGTRVSPIDSTSHDVKPLPRYFHLARSTLDEHLKSVKQRTVPIVFPEYPDFGCVQDLNRATEVPVLRYQEVTTQMVPLAMHRCRDVDDLRSSDRDIVIIGRSNFSGKRSNPFERYA